MAGEEKPTTLRGWQLLATQAHEENRVRLEKEWTSKLTDPLFREYMSTLASSASGNSSVAIDSPLHCVLSCSADVPNHQVPEAPSRKPLKDLKVMSTPLSSGDVLAFPQSAQPRMISERAVERQPPVSLPRTAQPKSSGTVPSALRARTASGASSCRTPERPADPRTPVRKPKKRTSPVKASSSVQDLTSVSTDSDGVIHVQNKGYIVKKVIGKGGSCIVYEVQSQEDNLLYALKIVSLKGLHDRLKEMHRNEVKILQELQDSDYVVKLIAFQDSGDDLYLVMELGMLTLGDLIREIKEKKRVIDIHFMRYYWSEMLRCVKVIHERNIVHADLKPANFLLVNSRVKLIDFGIAAKVNDVDKSVVLEGFLGTLSFMSPEAIGFRTKPGTKVYQITLKTDVWSLGCILYALCEGTTPFSKYVQKQAKMQAIQMGKLDFSNIKDKDVRDVIQRCLDRNVQTRPSVDELLQHRFLQTNKENLDDTMNLEEIFLEMHRQIANTTPRSGVRKMAEVFHSRKKLP